MNRKIWTWWRSSILVLIWGLLVIFQGCATRGELITLQKEVDGLKKAKASTTMALAEQAGARKFWWRNALTGAPDGLDQIPIAALTDGDAAFVMTLSSETATAYLYVYDADGTHSTDSPARIVANGATGCWHLVNFNLAQVTSSAADGTHYIDVSNTATLDAGSRAQGRCWYAKDNSRIECYNGSAVQYWTATGTE